MLAKSTKILKYTIGFLGAVIILLSIFLLSWLARTISELYPEYGYLRYPVLLGIYITEIPFFYALYQAIKLLNYIKAGSAFSEKALKALSHIRNCSFIIGLCYIAGMIYLISQNANHPSVSLIAFFIIFLSFVLAVFASLLHHLWQNALHIKIENDLTV